MLTVNLCDNFSDPIRRWVSGALLFIAHQDDGAIVVRNKFRSQLIDGLQRNRGDDLRHDLIVFLERRNGLPEQEVLHILLHVIVVLLLVSLVVELFDVAEPIGLCALVFAGGKTKIVHPFGFAKKGQEGRVGLPRFNDARQLHGIRRSHAKKGSIARSSICKRRILVLHHLLKSIRQHPVDHIRSEIVNEIIDHRFLLFGKGVTLIRDHKITRGLLLIRHHGYGRRLVIRYFFVHTLGGVHRFGNAAKNALHVFLDLLGIEISDDDNGLEVRTIPFMIVVAQLLRLKMIHDAHQANRHAFGVFTSGKDDWRDRVDQTRRGTATCPPLLVDYFSLLVDILVTQKERI